MARGADKVVLVTGGARGMGAAHAEALVAEGARVVIGDILDDAGRSVAEKLGDAAIFVHLDVADPALWDQALAATLERFGRLDALVNNAGIVKVGPLRGSSLSDWQRVLDVNLTGAYLGMRAVVEPMIAAGGGSIVNVSSIEGLRGSPWAPGCGARERGGRGGARSAALELAQHKIRVNSIHPGLVRTPMTDNIPDDLL